MARRIINIPVLCMLAVVVGFMGYTQFARASGDTWFQTGNYLRTDPYGTTFYAQGATWFDAVNTYTIYVWRTYLQMDITNTGTLNCDENSVQASAYNQTTSWYNAPFPLTYSNTPAWDYTTYASNFGTPYFSTYGASINEQCNSSLYGVPPGAWWSKSTGTGSWSYGAH